MPPSLSIIIPSVNDPDLKNTVRSIRETAGDSVEIVICDDCSANPVQCPEASNVIRNQHRCGCGPSRHIGAMLAGGDYLLFVDAHSRFTPGWHEAAMKRIAGRDKTLHCATCLALSKNNMDVTKPDAVYDRGATLNIAGPDVNARGKDQVMEVVWNKAPAADDQFIPAVMGADYFIPRKWFLELSPLRFLRGWGADELALSLAAWLCGGEVRLMKNVRIGHRFKAKDEKQLFTLPAGYPTFNKLFVMYTMLEDERLLALLTLRLQACTANDEWREAWRLILANWSVITTERMRLNGLRELDFLDYAGMFNIDPRFKPANQRSLD